MCGILAFMNFGDSPLDIGLIVRMRDTMHHRGPDDVGIYVEDSIALGHRRLSVIDLSDVARQPMTNEDRSIFLVCNGEIYNYLELRDDLIKRGHRFYSNSDSEVIIHQYEEYGSDCLHRFNGMFAFVLWDAKRQKLFGARDRIGIKPLYYYMDNNRAIFASEIKAIIEDPSVPRLPDYHALSDYLFAGRALGDKTVFENIKSLEPGHMINIIKTEKKVTVNRYWDILYDYDRSRSDSDLIEELSFLLNDAVKIHCRSDASLGCHLSGGLDSSTIVALASKHRKPLKTFSIKFSDEAHIDETKYAKSVASYVGADYFQSTPSPLDFRDAFPSLIWYMDMPMATNGGFSYFAVSKLAHQHVKVSLTGHGGDEVFAGYPAQFAASYNSTNMFSFDKLSTHTDRRISFRNFLANVIQKTPRGIYHSIRNRLFKKDLSFEDTWIYLHCAALPPLDTRLNKDFVRELHGYSPRDNYLDALMAPNTEELLDRCLYHDLKVYLPSLLHLEDRASMAVSIESRLPFLDFRIVELLGTVPPDQKVKGMQPKHLLRQIAASCLPDNVLKRQDKFAFPIPDKLWASNEVNEMTKEILLSEQSKNRGIFKESALRAASNNLSYAWPILNIELWFKLFIDKDSQWIDSLKISKALSKM